MSIPLLLAAGLVAVGGCERRPRGVDFSVDPDYDFGALRRVAIVDPPEPGRAPGLDRVLVDAASDALGSRFVVLYGNRLRVALQAAGMERDYQALRQQIRDGLEPDRTLLERISRAIGVDGIWATDLATFERRHDPDYSYATVMSSVSSGSGYASVHQTNRTASVTTVRLTARLFDASTGLVVWSGSKFYETSLNLESTGLKPIFRTVSEDFVLTLPAPRTASSRPEPSGQAGSPGELGTRESGQGGEAEKMRTSR